MHIFTGPAGVFLMGSILGAQIVITEIERNPAGYANEIPGGNSNKYIEISNTGFDTVEIVGLSVSNNVQSSYITALRDSLDEFCAHTDQSFLAPGQIGILLDPNYTDEANDRPYQFGSDCVLFSTHTRTFFSDFTRSSGVALQNDADSMYAVVADQDPDRYDGNERFSFTAHWGNEGKTGSLHRLFILRDSSRYREQDRSPGKLPDYSQGMLREYRYEDRTQEAAVAVYIRNYSRRADTAAVWENDSSIGTIKIPASGEAHRIFHLPKNESEFTVCGAYFCDSLDISSIWFPAEKVFISEISPRGGVNWFELWNTSTMAIDHSLWTVHKGQDTVSLPRGKIPAGGFAVFSEDSLSLQVENLYITDLFNLGHYGDSFSVEHTNIPVDAVSWEHGDFDDWDEESLHRRSSDGQWYIGPPSPGGYVHSGRDSIGVVVRPEIFIPDGSQDRDSLVIDIMQPTSLNEGTCIIYTARGEEVRRFSFQGTARITWDGKNRFGRDVPRGPLIIYTQAGGSLRKNEAVLWR
ncbi:MAG: hypothetical protein ACQEQ4_06905 [Fibrobacterota bacterium]